MARHRVLLSPFLVQTNLAASTLRPEVLHLNFWAAPIREKELREGGDQRPLACSAAAPFSAGISAPAGRGVGNAGGFDDCGELAGRWVCRQCHSVDFLA